MDNTIENQLQESLEEWADIEKLTYERQNKDKKIISKFCAENKAADIYHTLKLLEKYSGLASHDRETVEMMKSKYPQELDAKLLYDYLNMRDIYSDYLESGGECDD